MSRVKITEKEVEKIGFDHDRDKIYNMKETTAYRIGLTAIVALAFISVLIVITLPPERRNYEVHGADGTIYHTTNIYHGSERIWFTDDKGNRIELGGGYSVIEK